MGLKSLIGKIILINNTVDYSEANKNVIYKKYLPINDFQVTNELEEIFRNSIQYTKDRELNLGLGIILTLISHKNENIRAHALGKIYFLMDDEYIQEIIINYLKNMSGNNNRNIDKSAECSLDLIALEVHKFAISDIIFELLTGVVDRIKFKLSKSKFSLGLPFYSNNFFSNDVLEIRNKNEIFYLNNSLYSILRIFRTINRRICKMIPYFEEIENIQYEILIEDEEIQNNHITKLEFNEEDSLQNLASFYSKTFREKGHLRRLIALLDDTDYKVQQIGVNALIDVIKVLLTKSNEKKFIKALYNSHLDKSSQITG